jgi:hypothetical protein
VRAALLIVALASAAVSARAQVPPPPGTEPPAPALATADRVALTEAMRLVELVGDSLWPGWGEVPFAVLLVTPEAEFLIGHPRPTLDFAPAGAEPVLGPIRRRPRVFPPNLLATFPAVGGIPTIVVGRPEATDKGPTAWVLTILHERFHQLQMSHPDYYDGVNALGLARGDTTGQWMLEYAFPYENATVRGRFVELASRLLRSLETAGSDQFAARVRAYDAARERLRAALAPDDYRYAQFQLWQEGVARYTEIRVAELAAASAAAGGEPPNAFRMLPGYEPYSDAAARLRREVLEGLQTATLSTQRRVAFYPLGAATALLLDLVAPGWRDRTFTEPFALDPLFP